MSNASWKTLIYGTALPAALYVLVASAAAALPPQAEDQTDQSSKATGPLSWRDDLNPADRARVGGILEVDPTKAEVFENMTAGKSTYTGTLDTNAYSHFAPSLSFEQEQLFKLGNGLFRKVWVSAPSSTQASDGLGPLFNARACQQCHIKDGRGHPPQGLEPTLSMLIKTVVLNGSTGEPEHDQHYGEQIQNFSVAGVAAEADIKIAHEPVEVSINAGGGKTATVTLSKPLYSLRMANPQIEPAAQPSTAGQAEADPEHAPDHERRVLGPRVAPQMIGLGLLQSIHEGDLEALEDPDDSNGDGISGRIHRLASPTAEDVQADTAPAIIGRFGWKATTASIRQQSADAFFNDMGLSTPLRTDPWGDCTEWQVDCRQAPDGLGSYGNIVEKTEVSDESLDLIDFYSSNLAVPARRDFDNPEVLAGKSAFNEAGCGGCHVPKFVTSRDALQPEHRFQLIWPYTDLLLHDMGPGLADGVAVGTASGSEWRTAPLWGIGLTETVNGHTRYLHDGRASSMLEAILWHGGEAASAAGKVAAMAPDRRSALIRFVESL